MSLRFQRSIRRRRRDEEDESDDDDLFVVGFVLEGLKRKQREKKFRRSLRGHENMERDILGGHEKIYWDYFADESATMVSISEGGSGCPNRFFCG